MLNKDGGPANEYNKEALIVLRLCNIDLFQELHYKDGCKYQHFAICGSATSISTNC